MFTASQHLTQRGASSTDQSRLQRRSRRGQRDYLFLGQSENGLELFDKAIRLSPRDPSLQFMYFGKSWAYFGLKRYDQAIDWARRAIAIGPNNPFPQSSLRRWL
jgi:tetratricopeptide (TPR) repeat protein